MSIEQNLDSERTGCDFLGNLTKNEQESIEFIRSCLRKTIERDCSGHWAVLTTNVDGLTSYFNAMLSDEFSELAVQTADLSECRDYPSIRAMLNDRASGSGARLLIIKGLESKDEDTLNCGLGHFVSSLDDDQHRSSPEYTYEQKGLSVMVVIEDGVHDHLVKYALCQCGGFGLIEFTND